MKKAKDLFEALAINTYEMVTIEDGRAGFKIPEYQRQYDWSKENISRLCYNTLNGFARISESKHANSFTFLGTIILIKEKSKEEDFSGNSFAVVDGQQRLTTLSLFACALIEELKRYSNETKLLADTNLNKWLEQELDERLLYLYECVVGSQRVSPIENFPFPRIVRHNDRRGNSVSTSEYRSAIARFLKSFADYFASEKIEYILPSFGDDTDAIKLTENYKQIRSLIGNLNESDWYETTECEQFNIAGITSAQCRPLFNRLSDFIKDESERNRTLDLIKNKHELHAFVRTLLFASYFCNYIVLTRVTTDDESAAFDIFDALNTTGEPLTALETLKPRVINFENNYKEYRGSPSAVAFDTIDENLDQRILNTERKQTETKDLIVTFRLYLEGKKLSKDLAEQRNFLRQSYDNAEKSGPESARRFVEALAELTQFRRYYWKQDGIQQLIRFHPQDTVQEVQLLLSFIADMRTSLALPILARYWADVLKTKNDAHFVEVLRAVVGFILLRRAWTGGTDGIDGDFRAIMEQPTDGSRPNRKFGLCAGFDHTNALLSPSELKKALRDLLEHKLKMLSKDKWVSTVATNPLYARSEKLVRFMILMAAHQAAPSDTTPGVWNKSGIKSSAQYDFFSYSTWCGELYATVEHIAPSTEPEHGWDSSLYKNNILRDTVGNLVLLPRKENSVIGNDSWKKKRKFYKALSATSIADVDQFIEEAKADDIHFSKVAEGLLRSGEVLHLLDPLREVDEWHADIVEIQGRNIAELCWDHVWPWLNS